MSLWLFSAACSTKVVPCNGDAGADPENDCLPLPPENLNMVAEASGYRVSWDGMEGAEKYEMTTLCQLARVKLSDMNWGQTSDESTTENSYMLGLGSRPVDPGDVCYMRLRTCNQFGCGRWMEREFILGIKPPSEIVPRVGVRAMGGVSFMTKAFDLTRNYTIENNTFRIVWKLVANTNLTRYIIQEREGASGSWQAPPGTGAGSGDGNIPLADASTLADDFTGDLTRVYGKNYFFRVKSCGTEGGAEVCGPWSLASKLLLRLPPPASLGMSSANLYSGNYRLSWSAGASSAGVSSASSIDRYQIEESTDGGNTWGPSSPAFSPAFSPALEETYAKPIGTYSYRIRSCVAGGVASNVTCSAWNTKLNLVTVDPLPVVTGVVSNATNGVSSDASYEISWNTVTDASEYEITESTGGVAQTPVKVSQASQSYTRAKHMGRPTPTQSGPVLVTLVAIVVLPLAPCPWK